MLSDSLFPSGLFVSSYPRFRLGVAMTLGISLAWAAPPEPQLLSQSVWQEIGAGSPVLDKDGQPGIVRRPSFSDASKPRLMTAAICNQEEALFGDWTSCRLATSFDQDATWVRHSSVNFSEIEEKPLGGRSPSIVRSPVNPKRLYFSAIGHSWDIADPRGGLWRSDDGGLHLDRSPPISNCSAPSIVELPGSPSRQPASQTPRRSFRASLRLTTPAC